MFIFFCFAPLNMLLCRASIFRGTVFLWSQKKSIYLFYLEYRQMSEAIYTLDGEVRTGKGKGASRRLRHAQRVPAIIYGGGQDPVSLSFEHKHVIKAQENEGFYSHILTVNVGGEPIQCILKDMQRHPFRLSVMHLDFQRVSADHKLQTTVPLHFINEDTNEALKAGGILNHLSNDIHISCLPAHLPEFIEVDVANLEIGQSLHISNVVLPEGVASVELAKGEGHDQALVNIHTPRGNAADEEEDAATAEAAAGASAE
ncbi:MAG: large subunit ribosomal protein L25 [Phenylobacterium sp.]|jgi:large subunit ribosomal protein L25